MASRQFGRLVLIPLVLIVIAGSSLAQAAPGKLALTSGWQIQSACKAPEKGELISTTAYNPSGWMPTTVPNTVVAALVAAKADKVYEDIYFGKNLLNLPGMDYERGKIFSRFPMKDDSPFKCAWWYRTEFKVPATYKARQIWLSFGGINYRANVWLNGKQIASSNDVAGAYRTYEFNVSEGLKAGEANVLAVEITAPTEKDLGINWVDWNPAPPDKNMGLWREVYLTTSGPVAIRNPYVNSKVAKTLDSAELTVTAEVQNTTAKPVKGTLTGTIGAVKLSQRVALAPGETKVVTFTPEKFPQLQMKSPQLWWPYQMGKPNLQTLNVTFDINGSLSDSGAVRFGVREVTSELTDKGARLFRINGKPILIRGAGWAPDMLLREDNARVDKELAYVKHMGLNTVRLEGKMETEYFYNRADEMGILLMPGWCCCDIWEEWKKWTPETRKVAQESLRSQMLALRNHPSVYVWLNGSDNPPAPEVEKEYLDVARQVNWPNPIVSSATAKSSEVSGKSGVKMSGPYDWVAPAYWLTDKDKLGGGWGYNTETGPGPAFPPVDSLKKFVPADQLWPISDTTLYHAGMGKFQHMDLMTDAMNERYGKAADLEDFERKAQAIAYEGERAMFEAYSRNKYTSTGVIQWMLNNAWPGIIWHLYDYYLKAAGGYFGTKKANEPLHVMYGYDDRSVYVVNSTYEPVRGLKARATVLNFDATSKFTREMNVDLPGDGVVKAFELPEIADLSTTYFVRLELFQGTKRVSENFYWLSTKPDVFDWEKSSYYHTPMKQHADLSMLNTLPKVDLVVTDLKTYAPLANPPKTHWHERIKATSATSQSAKPDAARPRQNWTMVKVTNPSRAVAFMVRLRLLKRSVASVTDAGPKEGDATSLNPMAAGGEDVLPVLWDDNYFTLLPGEVREISASYGTADLGGAKPVIAVEGWNVVPKVVVAK